MKLKHQVFLLVQCNAQCLVRCVYFLVSKLPILATFLTEKKTGSFWGSSNASNISFNANFLTVLLPFTALTSQAIDVSPCFLKTLKPCVVGACKGGDIS